LHAEKRVIAEEQRILVARLLRENISLRGICRAIGVGIKWLMHFKVGHFEAAPGHLQIQLPGSPGDVIVQQLDAEADEVCSVVGKKTNKQWLWMAIDTQTRQIIAFHMEDRSRKSAEQIWAKIPVAYREQVTFYTDRDEAYKGVIPAARHKAMTKLARRTNHIKRFNNTLRQRVSRLARDTLAFSKKLANHIGAIKLFIGEYNLTRTAVLHG
jgi:insertion element IS1 protein InsB